eukprot:5032399-Amphidinium_carterae.2
MQLHGGGAQVCNNVSKRQQVLGAMVTSLCNKRAHSHGAPGVVLVDVLVIHQPARTRPPHMIQVQATKTPPNSASPDAQPTSGSG